ncbi:MAG: ATP-binding cassette domain-containing protein [Tepidanaerobacteraceae bacterium]|jgi:cobalt/nickel transport system ATP-binding protein|nr:ATP-binding cassette domain-containing protein [Tepidanaerobacteraceae bacterium]
MDCAVEIDDLFFHHKDGTRALKGINLRIRRGRRTVILGPNGAGKSTLLLHLNGIYLPQKGTVKVLGMEVNPKNEKKLREIVGLVFQDPDDQVFCPTVWEDVAFGPLNYDLPEEEVDKRVDEALKAVRLEGLEQKAPFHLSYGQKKRVAIAGVLALKPEIFILDEPHAFLDPYSRAELLKILDALNGQGSSIIVATHDVDFAYEWADDVVVMKDGIVLASGDRNILTDDKIINEAELEYPLLVKLFKKLSEARCDKIPASVDEAAEFLRRKMNGKCQ